MSKTMIVAIVYHEPEWQKTKDCILATGAPVIFVERNPEGVGSLAEAINRGFTLVPEEYEYVWFVTNITFSPTLIEELEYQMDIAKGSKLAAIHPCFDSDHIWLKQKNVGHRSPTLAVPFIEFTAAFVRADVFDDFKLDENMPYMGHDIDWGYRIREAGMWLGCYHDEKIGHVYIRHNKRPNRYTLQRIKARKATNASTIAAIETKYNQKWQDLKYPKFETEIGAFYAEVVKTQFYNKL